MTGKLQTLATTFPQLPSLKQAIGKSRKLSYAIYFLWRKPVCHRIAKTQLVNTARHQGETRDGDRETRCQSHYIIV